MLEALVIGALNLINPTVLVSMLAGILVGLVVGILPGIGVMITYALCLPFIFGMPPAVAIGFLIALASVTTTSGSITAALLSIPGESSSAAGMLDSYPMTQKGEGGRAIGAAVFSSLAGGTLPVFFALLMIPVLVPILLAFKSPEKCLLVLLGLSFIAVLTGRSPTRGLIAGLFGLLLTLIGFDTATGTPRFTFGSIFLVDGLRIEVIALGLFGLSELLDMFLQEQTSIAQVEGKLSGVLDGVKDVIRYKWLWLRSAIIGYIVGLLPGTGSHMATWVCYAQAKLTSKHPEKFGTGAIEGVIAPESANNAKEAGALLTTLAFGIPGNAPMAILMGAFLLVGVTPGPEMMTSNLPLAFTLLLGVALANVVGGIICLFCARPLSRLAFVHTDFLFPIILILIFVGAFVTLGDMTNVVVAVLFGLLGFFMKRFDYPRAAMILGFVLGGLFEYYLWLSLKVSGPLFFLTPISLTMIAVMIGLFSYAYLRKTFARLRKETEKT
ncbi:tripartite tricarboxylate transporter permease [Thermodesulfobacteriota bacterium]